jgi:hypothetical protein
MTAVVRVAAVITFFEIDIDKPENSEINENQLQGKYWRIIDWTRLIERSFGNSMQTVGSHTRN